MHHSVFMVRLWFPRLCRAPSAKCRVYTSGKHVHASSIGLDTIEALSVLYLSEMIQDPDTFSRELAKEDVSGKRRHMT